MSSSSPASLLPSTSASASSSIQQDLDPLIAAVAGAVQAEQPSSSSQLDPSLGEPVASTSASGIVVPAKRGRGRPRKNPDAPRKVVDPNAPKRGRGRPKKTPEQREADRLAKLALNLPPKPKPKPKPKPPPEPEYDEDGNEIVREAKKRGRPLGSKNKPGHNAGRPKKGTVKEPKVKIRKPMGRPRKVPRVEGEAVVAAPPAPSLDADQGVSPSIVADAMQHLEHLDHLSHPEHLDRLGPLNLGDFPGINITGGDIIDLHGDIIVGGPSTSGAHNDSVIDPQLEQLGQAVSFMSQSTVETMATVANEAKGKRKVAAIANAVSRLAVPLVLGAGLVQASIYDVPGGHRAIIFDRFSGVREKPSEEGTHLLVPWLQRAILYDVRIKPMVISTKTGSKDMQMVSLSLRVMSRPDTTYLSTIYRSLGLDYSERVLPSIGNEVLKATVAQFDAAELITQREVVSSRIRADLLKRAGEFNIVLEDVSITHMTFGREFTQAVEQKQVAQQEAERAKFIVERSEQERQASVVRAEGEAEAATIISKALSKAGEGLVQFRRIEASKEIAATLSKGRNVTYLPGSGNVLLNVDSK